MKIKWIIAAPLLITMSHAVFAKNIAQISYDNRWFAGARNAFALNEKGVVFRITRDDSLPPLSLPVLIKIDAGYGHHLGLTTNGEVVSWGGDLGGSLSIPLEVRSGVIDIASGHDGYYGDQNWALKSNGTVVHWKNNSPTETFARANVKSIAFCANTTALGLRHDGSVIQLRTGNQLNVSNVKKIACGNYRTWFLLNNGHVVQLNDQNQVVYANAQATGNAIDIGTTISRLYVLKADGTVVSANADGGGAVNQPPSRLTKNIKALAGDIAIRRDGSVILFDEEAMRVQFQPYFKNERNDLNGDRIDEAIWRSSINSDIYRTVFEGRGAGFALTNIGWVGGTNWPIVGKGTFTQFADNIRTGYIAKNPSNNRYYYDRFTYGSISISDSAEWFMGTFGANTRLELTGDIDGDGVDEIVWRNTQTGSTSIGFYQGSTPVYRNIGSYANNVRFEGITDFDDNGYADILFRNTNDGNTMILHLDQTVMTASPTRTWKSISTIHKNLNIVALADLNMDGIDDIVVQNPVSGRVMVARMTRNLNVSLNWTDVITIAPPVKLINVGDYDGDGFKDLLWHNPSSGNVAVTYIENYLPVATHTEGSVPTNFSPVK